jgi:two-component system cell cycle sensor histidine kinase/response regulator CckA
VAAEEAAESVRPAPDTSTQAMATGALILVVEDEPAVRALAARMLERSGYRVLLASNGKEALDLVDRHGPPQLVLTDLMMPDISGAELGRRLSQRWPALPLIFMSGHTPEELHWPAAVGGSNGLLQKPFTLAGLLLRVTEALAHSSMVGPMRFNRSRAGLRLEQEPS